MAEKHHTQLFNIGAIHNAVLHLSVNKPCTIEPKTRPTEQITSDIASCAILQATQQL